MGKTNWTLAFLVAGIADLVDYIVPIFLLPVVGDVIDIITIPILYSLIGNYAFISAAELIPGEDILPTNLIAVGIAYSQK